MTGSIELTHHGRRLAKCVEDSLLEVIGENFPDAEHKEKVALLLYTAQLILADCFLASARDRAHALQGIDLTARHIKESINKFYDLKEKSNEHRNPTPEDKT